MRFMIVHKMTAEMEKGLPPDPEIIAGVGRLIEAGAAEKVFVSGEGLKPSSERTHLVYANGKRASMERGPFAEPKELLSGFTLLRVSSEAEALAWCDELGAVFGDAEIHLGPIVEPWDLGMMEKPASPPARFLALHRLGSRGAPETAPSAEVVAKLGALVDRMSRAGVLQGSAALAETKKGARLRFEGSKRTVIDGPFAESKELVAGYAILELPSKAAALEWARDFGDVVKVEEVDVREIV